MLRSEFSNHSRRPLVRLFLFLSRIGVTMNARCRILATYLETVSVDTETVGGYFRCPSSPHRFHYHGETLASGELELTSMRRLCYHRHQTADEAIKCTERG